MENEVSTGTTSIFLGILQNVSKCVNDAGGTPSIFSLSHMYQMHVVGNACKPMSLSQLRPIRKSARSAATHPCIRNHSNLCLSTQFPAPNSALKGDKDADN